MAGIAQAGSAADAQQAFRHSARCRPTAVCSAFVLYSRIPNDKRQLTNDNSGARCAPAVSYSTFVVYSIPMTSDD
jgi:hypothetical protein